MRKSSFAYVKINKGSHQLHVKGQLISAFVFATYKILYNSSTSNIRNFQPVAIFFVCKAHFVLNLVENPEDRFWF